MDNKKATLALGTKPVGQLLRQYALPAIVAMVASSLYNIIDRAFIGQVVGPMAISGLAITFPFMNLSGAFGAAVGVGASTAISVKLGQKDYQTAEQLLGNTVTLNLLIGFVFVEKQYRGHRLSQRLIEKAAQYAALCGYGKVYLMSGEKVHGNRTTKYSLIEEAIQEEIYGPSSGNIIRIDFSDILAETMDAERPNLSNRDEKEDEIEADKELELNYRLALDDEIAEFYFQHFPSEYIKRKDLISACVRKGDVGRAIELVDMMAETKGNEGYEERNGWGRQNMLTIMYLIDEYEYGKEERWDSKKDITDEMRETVKQLVYRMMPYLPPKAAAELKEKSLHKIDPASEDTDEYITQLLEDADVYTTFPKPRGKGGAPNINRMSSQFMQCFERLSKMGRLDVVAEIMGKFAAVHDILKPVAYNTWSLKSGDMIKIYRLNRGIFEAWLDGDNLRDWDILNVARGIADGCTREEFMDFRNLVVSRKGKIDGLDACYQATSENTETQELLEGETVKIDLDFIEITGDNPVSVVEIHLISTAKTRKLDSVRLLKCEVNGIVTTDCGFLSEMDGEPSIGYNIYRVNEESQDKLTIYSNFFDENDINEVNRIVLHFVVMDDDADVIEEVSEAIIELDNESGEYRVLQKAESEDCYLDVDDDDEDVDDSDSGTSFDLSDLLKQLLQAHGSSDDDSSEEDDDSDEEDDSEDSDEDEEFEDITIYDDDDVLIDFCGVEFDAFSEELTLSIWCRNYLEEKRRFWISKITVNGNSHATWKLIGEVEDDSDYCDYTLSEVDGLDYEDIETIEFQIEVDDEGNEAIGTSKTVLLKVDTDEETFKAIVS